MITAAISVAVMIGLTAVDYTYTLAGAILFYLTNTFYQHYKLPKLFEGFDNRRFWNHLAVIVAGVGLAVCAAFLFPIQPANFVWWFVYACATGICSLIILFVLLVLLDRESLKHTVAYFVNRKRK